MCFGLVQKATTRPLERAARLSLSVGAKDWLPGPVPRPDGPVDLPDEPVVGSDGPAMARKAARGWHSIS